MTEHPHLPSSSAWPATLAAGAALLAASIVTNWVVGLAGLILVVAALAGWLALLLEGR